MSVIGFPRRSKGETYIFEKRGRRGGLLDGSLDASSSRQAELAVPAPSLELQSLLMLQALSFST